MCIHRVKGIQPNTKHRTMWIYFSLFIHYFPKINASLLPKLQIQEFPFGYHTHTHTHTHTRTHAHTHSFWISPGFPGVSDGKQAACNAGDPGFDPCIRKSPGEGNDNPLQYSCLENSLGRGAWHATIMKWPRVGHNLGTKAHTSHMWNQNSILKIAFLESIRFWDCIQILHFRLFCWPWWLLHFF